MVDQSFSASFEPFAHRDSQLTWSDTMLIVRGIDDGWVLSDGYVPLLFRREAGWVIPVTRLVAVRVCQPWPALEIAWSDGVVSRRLLAHPRGLTRLVPASDGARTAFAHHEIRVTELVDTLERRHPHVQVERGWLDDDVVWWTRRDALPGKSTPSGSYRDAVVPDRLLAHAKVQRPLHTRARIALRRRLGDDRDPMPIELALSEHEIWIVDDAASVWAVPRRSLRAVYVDAARIACIFGRNTFLAMSIAPSPIRAQLIEIAERAVLQNEALRAG